MNMIAIEGTGFVQLKWQDVLTAIFLRTAVGTARDISFVIDFLPAYLFPNEERSIAEWAVAGISLGGQTMWLVFKDGAPLSVPFVPSGKTPSSDCLCRQT